MQLELGELDLRYADLRIRDAARERRLVASVLEHGQLTPVLIVRVAKTHVLIDGYVRIAALRKLGRDVVEAAALDVAEAEALVLGHRLDNGRERTALEEGWLLRELCERHGVVQRELARRLDRSESWVSRRLGLVKTLPDSVQQTVRTGKLSVQAATKYLVPLARANAAQCERMVRELGGDPVSVRQMQRLYVAWKQGDDEQRERLVNEPRLFLRASEADDAKDKPEDDEHAATMRDLSVVTAVCLRLCRRLGESDGPITKHARASRRAAWIRVKRAFAALQAHFEQQETTDARSRHSNRDLAAAQRGPRRTNDRPNPEGLSGSSPQRPT
jgi:ParB/RepB/Spo0J family partition protein